MLAGGVGWTGGLREWHSVTRVSSRLRSGVRASSAQVGVRWTVGDVSLRGWEALRLSVWCAWRLFGPEAGYVICVNSIPLGGSAGEDGGVAGGGGMAAGGAERGMPGWLEARHLDREMAEGVGWKLVPTQVFPERWEIALDNDCIVWALPEGMRKFLGRRDATLMAEDVDRCLGQFDAVAPEGKINSGIRGLPPGFGLEAALRAVLAGSSAREWCCGRSWMNRACRRAALARGGNFAAGIGRMR